MKNVLQFIKRFHFAIIFILLEIIAIGLSINSNVQKRTFFLNSTNFVSSNIYTRIFSVRNYFDLNEQNKILLRENSKLKNKLKGSNFFDTSLYEIVHDTLFIQQYTYRPGKVINNSVNKNNNYITINRGSKHGVVREMAVVSPNGIVGIITNVSRNYSIAISVLNSKIGISARLKYLDYFGSVVWEQKSYDIAKLNGIPNHLKINIGDTVITSGYSAIFPEGLLIGTIKDYKKNNLDNFYSIEVELSQNMKKVKNIYLIKNLLREEQIKLQEKMLEEN